MERMNVQAELVRILRKKLNVAVLTSIPEGYELPLIVVQRIGGAMQNKLIDRAGVGISVYDTTEAKAAALALKVSAVMLSLEFSHGFAQVSETVLRSDFDLKLHCPRWFGSYSITNYKVRS